MAWRFLHCGVDRPGDLEGSSEPGAVQPAGRAAWSGRAALRRGAWHNAWCAGRCRAGAVGAGVTSGPQVKIPGRVSGGAERACLGRAGLAGVRVGAGRSADVVGLAQVRQRGLEVAGQRLGGLQAVIGRARLDYRVRARRLAVAGGPPPPAPRRHLPPQQARPTAPPPASSSGWTCRWAITTPGALPTTWSSRTCPGMPARSAAIPGSQRSASAAASSAARQAGAPPRQPRSGSPTGQPQPRTCRSPIREDTATGAFCPRHGQQPWRHETLPTAAGLRVYPPNQFASKVIPYPFPACPHAGPVYIHAGPVTPGGPPS